MANKYYDPIKAHEYYMKHRQLKGNSKGKKAKKITLASRLSNDGLNEAGVEQANRLKAEMKVRKAAFNKQMREKMKAEVKALKEKMAGMSEEEISVQIELLKDKYRDKQKANNTKMKEELASKMDGLKADALMKA